VYQSLANHLVVLIVAGVVPVVEQCAEHGTRLPPVVGWVEDTGIPSKYMYAFVVDCRVLRNELFSDLTGDIFDGSYSTTSVSSTGANDCATRTPASYPLNWDLGRWPG
jgi:hypothetical protein